MILTKNHIMNLKKISNKKEFRTMVIKDFSMFQKIKLSKLKNATPTGSQVLKNLQKV